MDKTKTRTFLGEVWVHPLPFFKADKEHTVETPGSKDRELAWKRQARDGGGAGDIPLDYKEGSTRQELEGEKRAPNVLKGATIDFEARWVLEKDFKGRFYMKMHNIKQLERGGKEIPRGNIVVEHWEYGQ